MAVAPPLPASHAAPLTIGRYAVFGEIAAGGMATVHFGRLIGDSGFSRPVAVKRLHPHLAKDPEFRAMFLDEARLVARIRHQNVVPTLDVVASETELFLVMEYVQGESLWRLMKAARARGERVPPSIAMAIAAQMLHGLHAAHEATTETGEPLSIVHRDVSPQNVLVGTDGAARIVDFGVARASWRIETTREGRVKGKLAYMAPEQLGGGEVARQADVYAASVVLWELLTGQRLFHKGDPQSVLIEKLFHGVPAKPSAHFEDVPEALDAIVLRGLAREPSDRFPTARAMAIAIESAGKLAPHSEVSAWVEALAHDALEGRARAVAEVESCSLRAAAPHDPEGEERTTKRLDPRREEAPPARMHGAPPRQALAPFHEPSAAPLASPAAPHVDRRRLAIAAGVGGAAAAALFAVAWLGVRALRGDAHGSASAEGPASVVGMPTAAPPVPAAASPACPAGMTEIPGGKFFMGADDGLPFERPAHNVTLAPFCMDPHEVTTAEYKACSDRGECKRAGTTNEWAGITRDERKAFDPLCNARDPEKRAKHPINCVDWEMARTFCEAKGARLPTEAEWEFAARSSDGRKYPWGDAEPTPKHLNACGRECVEWGKRNHVDEDTMFPGDDGWATTAPVGSYPAGRSPFGLDDMVGNVWEWVADAYGPYAAAPQVNPTGAAGPAKERVIRGGAWNGAYPAWVRPTFRYRDVPEKRSYGIGFRCAASKS